MAFRVARVRGKLSAMLPRHEPAGASRPVKAEMIRSPLRSLFTMIATAPRVSLSHAHRQAQAALLRRGHIADARASCLDIADRPWLFVFVSGCRLRSVVLQLATARRGLRRWVRTDSVESCHVRRARSARRSRESVLRVCGRTVVVSAVSVTVSGLR